MTIEQKAVEGDYVECINGSFGVVRGKSIIWLHQPDREHFHPQPELLLASTLSRILTKEEFTFILLGD